MRHRTLLVLVILAAVSLLSTGCSLSKLKTSADLAARSEAFQARPDNPTQRLLIMGDSTAVGTGASTPGTSVAGLIAREHPGWQIDNRAVDGARFADLLGQLPMADRYDTVLVMCGGNDVLRLTSSASLQAAIHAVLQRSHTLAPRVIVVPPGNIGNAPALYPPLSWWMGSRARTLHSLVREAAAASGSVYVNLYEDRDKDPFAQDPQRMNAADGLHPSDAGYALWFRALKSASGI